MAIIVAVVSIMSVMAKSKAKTNGRPGGIHHWWRNIHRCRCINHRRGNLNDLGRLVNDRRRRGNVYRSCRSHGGDSDDRGRGDIDWRGCDSDVNSKPDAGICLASDGGYCCY